MDERAFACAAMALCTTAAFGDGRRSGRILRDGDRVRSRRPGTRRRGRGPQIVGDRRTIETVVTVAVVDALKGRARGDRVLPRARRPGRSLSARDGRRAGVRRRRGGRALSQGPRAGVPLPFGLSQGVYRVVRGAAGQSLVTPPRWRQSPAASSAAIPSRRPMELAAFARSVRAIVEGRQR